MVVTVSEGSSKELIARARERVAANRRFAKHHTTQPTLDELYADHARLADALETALADMHERELHHFEVERELADIWDEVGGVLQTPPDTVTVPEYRRRVIEMIQERGKR